VTLPEFRDLVDAQHPRDGRRLAVPVAVRRSADLLTPVSAFLALRESGAFGFLLESVEAGEHLGRYSFLGRDPFLVVEARGERTLLHRPGGPIGGDGAAHEVEAQTGTLTETLGLLLDRVVPAQVPGLPRFTAGAVGYLGYDTVRQFERLGPGPPDVLGVPDAVWGLYDTVVAFDHVRHQLVLIATAFVGEDDDVEALHEDAMERIEELTEVLRAGAPPPGDDIRLLADEPRSNLTREAFEAAVRTAQQHITDGDIFQVVLSQRLSMPFTGDRFNLYRALRQVNPSPYLFYLDVDGLDDADSVSGGTFTLIGSSPEVLARVDPLADGAERRAVVLPIAGTRPRGATPAEDDANAAALRADAKEQAEHLMLVDLGRNDLGRVARPGAVTVERLAEVERFSHVMHLVSQVSADVGPAPALDVLAACFPAGTVSGAPKVRAMELIDQLEPVRRGPYAGAVGYAGFDGALDTAITIRTMLVRDEPTMTRPDRQMAYVQAGAGVVADSVPSAEADETRAKAAALFAAMRTAADDLL